MAPGARGANKPIPGGKTVRSGPNQTFPGHSAAQRPREKEGEREREPRRRRRRRRPGLAGEPLSVAGAGALRARRLDPGSWGSAGQSERGAPGGLRALGSGGGPAPPPPPPPRAPASALPLPPPFAPLAPGPPGPRPGCGSVRQGQGGGPGAGSCRIPGRGRGWQRNCEGGRGGLGLCLRTA